MEGTKSSCGGPASEEEERKRHTAEWKEAGLVYYMQSVTNSAGSGDIPGNRGPGLRCPGALVPWWARRQRHVRGRHVVISSRIVACMLFCECRHTSCGRRTRKVRRQRPVRGRHVVISSRIVAYMLFCESRHTSCGRRTRKVEEPSLYPSE
jgi:hypothetical protein